MHRALVSRRVRIIVARELQVPFPRVKEDDEFVALGADSLDMVALPARFEEEFDVAISDDEAAFARTIATAVDIIHHKLENRTTVRRVFASALRPRPIDPIDWDRAAALGDVRLAAGQRLNHGRAD